MIFYLGTHKTGFLKRTSVPLFISRRALEVRKALPKAIGPWALDSGAFSELSLFGRWTLSAADYVAQVRRYRDEIGRMEWAAIQDWMCEPFITAKTGLDVAEHQRRTVASYLELTSIAPDIWWVPVLQGWELDEYIEHIEQYRESGVDLTSLPLVGVGSVCRRQGSQEAAEIIRAIAKRGIRAHGFGFKTKGLVLCSRWLASADSLAWSYVARRENIKLPECTHRAKRCSHCLRWALVWRGRVLDAIARQSLVQEWLW